ncbi:hypothetical protein JN531_016640 (plasmid) [Flagellatimonas centrodinii]|uniref:hypothetical protein n=1 Tax=Flagellatimonas centrodinii TaxID=2806210 RepID=UPI001FED984A|nr:hypothetical protein [Flagellatimonas centrodinii]ULQ48405.1 hypothetical protein JN531_016640 [Flagellatimonas centrodinii]
MDANRHLASGIALPLKWRAGAFDSLAKQGELLASDCTAAGVRPETRMVVATALTWFLRSRHITRGAVARAWRSPSATSELRSILSTATTQFGEELSSASSRFMLSDIGCPQLRFEQVVGPVVFVIPGGREGPPSTLRPFVWWVALRCGRGAEVPTITDFLQGGWYGDELLCYLKGAHTEAALVEAMDRLANMDEEETEGTGLYAAQHTLWNLEDGRRHLVAAELARRRSERDVQNSKKLRSRSAAVAAFGALPKRVRRSVWGRWVETGLEILRKYERSARKLCRHYQECEVSLKVGAVLAGSMDELPLCDVEWNVIDETGEFPCVLIDGDPGVAREVVAGLVGMARLLEHLQNLPGSKNGN